MLKYLFIFALFSIIGWILEVTYKSITNKNIINPGLLIGCSVPLYGFGGVFLNILCNLLIDINSNYKIILLFIISIILLTLLEYIIGKIILKIFNIKFWDYSNLKLNYQGIICLSFSLIWGILSILFYYFIYPWLDNLSMTIINNSIGLFLLGIYYGSFIIEIFVTIDLLNKLKKYSKGIHIIINIEKLKISLSNNNKLLYKIYPYSIINKYIKEKISD